MRKGRKLLLSAAVIAALGMAAPGVINNAQALDPSTYELNLQEAGNDCPLTSNKHVVHIAKQALPASGMTFKLKDVMDNDTTKGIVKVLGDMITAAAGAGSSDNTTTLTFVLNNAEFADSNVYLLIDNDTGYTNPISIQGNKVSNNKVTFNVKESEIDALNSVTKIYLVGKDNSTAFSDQELSIKVPGGLNSGDKGVLELTTTLGDGTKPNYGCVRRPIFVVEDQFIAHTCCCKGGNETSDNDTIVLNNGKITIMDDEDGVVGYSLYNVCPKCHTGGGGGGGETCCPTEDTCYDFFCNQQTITSTTTTGGCILPGICQEDVDCKTGEGLRIFQNADFDPHIPFIGVDSLHNTAVQLTLKSTDMKLTDMKSIEVIGLDGTVLGTFSVDPNDEYTATASINGSALFTPQNQDSSGAAAFRIKITPKEDAEVKNTSFSLSGVINPDGTYMYNDNALDWGTIITWGYGNNLTRGHIPLVFTGGGYSTYVNIFSQTDALVGAYVMTNDGKKVFVNLGTIEAGKKFMVTGDDIKNAAEAAGYEVFNKDGVYQFPVDIIVGASQTNVYGYAIMVQPGQIGSVRIPIFADNTKGAIDD